MSRARLSAPAALLVGAALALGATSALAQDGHDAHDDHGAQPGQPGAGVPKRVALPGRPGRPGGSAAPARTLFPVNQPPGDPHGAHGAHGEAAPHGEGHGEEHHTPPFNFVNGLLGEKDGVEPSLLWRAKGTPPPFLALLINFGILIGLGIRFAKKPIVDGVKDRKKNIMRDIDEATKTKAAAKKRYSEYKKKLDSIDEELERIRTEYAEQAARDKTRILADAEAGRDRMTKDAQFVLEQERKQLQQELLVQTVARATQGAEDLLRQRLGASDQDRLAEEFLSTLGASLGPSRSSTGATS
jgi:F-type H+-transporting ATPase subunit b